MEVEHCEEEDLKSPEELFYRHSRAVKQPFIPFLPYQVDDNTERGSSHLMNQAFLLRGKQTNGTGKGRQPPRKVQPADNTTPKS